MDPVLLGFIIAFVVDTIFNVVYQLKYRAGKLKIDQTNPEKDLYLVEFDVDLDKLPKKKWIILRVDAKAKLSQE